MKKITKILAVLVASLTFLVSWSGHSEAKKYLVLDLWQGVEGHNFNSVENKIWILNCIVEQIKKRGDENNWRIEWKDLYAGNFPDDGGYGMSETAKVACNWDPNAYILFIIVDECFINHTDFNHWRTGHVDLKDPFVGISCFLYSGSGESICNHGLSKHLSNRMEDPHVLLDALYRKCFERSWNTFFDPWLYGPREEERRGHYTEDFIKY